MPLVNRNMSALLLLSLVSFVAGDDSDQIVKRHQQCNPQMLADGETCEGSHNLLDESSDALSLMQLRMSVADMDSASASESSGVNDLVQAAISMYEKNGGQVTPAVQAFLTAVLKQITALYPKIEDAHDTNDKDLKRLHAAIKAVIVKLDKDKTTAAGMGAAAASLRKQLSTCRTAESGIWSRHQTCLGEKAVLTNIKNKKSEAASGTMTILKGMFSSGPSVKDMLVPGFRAKLASTSLTFVSQNKELDIALDDLAKKTKECQGIAKDLSSKKAGCDKAQSTFESASCKHAVFISETCKAFAKDWSAAVAAYESEIKVVKALEADRKVEFVGLKHAQCILKAISGKDLSAAKIESCKSEKIATGHLTISPGATPGKPSCPSVPPYPCTDTFKDNEYSKMPKGTKAAKCEECSGV